MSAKITVAATFDWPGRCPHCHGKFRSLWCGGLGWLCECLDCGRCWTTERAA